VVVEEEALVVGEAVLGLAVASAAEEREQGSRQEH